MDHKFQQNFDILMDKREFDFKSVINLSGLDGLDQSLMSMAVIQESISTLHQAKEQLAIKDLSSQVLNGSVDLNELLGLMNNEIS